MFGRIIGSVSVLGVLMTLLLSGVAGAKSAQTPTVQQTSTPEKKAALQHTVKGTAEEGPHTSPAADFHQESRIPSTDSYWHSRRGSKNSTSQQTLQKKEYTPQQAKTEKGQRNQAKLKVSVGGSGAKKNQMEAQIARLRAEDHAGLFKIPAASGGEPQFRESELQIAQEDIVAQPVDPIPLERYAEIYKKSAKQYGFEKDWYVLAAVGKIESNHGENMGPSSAGALGPMQFLPSTWKQYEVDGNGDGVANIMDPEDAIPAAAAYLKDGGAPKNWYQALYSYSHAGWYVRKVMRIAEAYRRQASDEEVEPYL